MGLQGDAIRNYYHERHIIQDMLVPSYKVGDALEFSEREFEVRVLAEARCICVICECGQLFGCDPTPMR